MLLFATNSKAVSAIALDCSYGMTLFSAIGTVYTCHARVLFDGNENVTSVYGTHETGKGHDDVKALSIVSQNLSFVPTNIESFFGNIIVFDLYLNVITSLSNRHLIPFPSLQYLSLSSLIATFSLE